MQTPSKPLANKLSLHAWFNEIWASLVLSLPLILTNMAQVAMGMTDLIFIGALSSEALAAAGLALNLYTAFTFFGFGLVLATSPMVSAILGADRGAIKPVRDAVRSGLWSALLYSIPVCLFLYQGEVILNALGQNPESAQEAGVYLQTLVWAMPSFLIYIVFRSVVTAMHRPMYAFVIALFAVLINALGNGLWVQGWWGAPQLGLWGSGLATSIASACLVIGMIAVVYINPAFKRFHLLKSFFSIRWTSLREFWRLGLPIGASIAFEVTIFNVAAFLMGRLGTQELAAHMIAINIASFVYMIPNGIAQAATVRVGYAFGAKNTQAIYQAGWGAFLLGMIFVAVTAFILFAFPQTLISMFIDIKRPENTQVLMLATSYLMVAALFQLVDGAQALFAGMLRGIYDTTLPMIFAAIGYWGIGIPVSVLLAFFYDLRGVGIWLGLAIGLSAVSLFLWSRWYRREPLGLVNF